MQCCTARETAAYKMIMKPNSEKLIYCRIIVLDRLKLSLTNNCVDDTQLKLLALVSLMLPHAALFCAK